MSRAATTPLVIEAAINGSTAKSLNPNVPRSIDEIVDTALACVDAGAAIVHNHNDEPDFGEPSRHSADPYERAWRRIWAHHPELLIYPTNSGERSASLEVRFAHVVELERRDALAMVLVDAGCVALAANGADGLVPMPVYGNSAAEVAWIFEWCRDHELPTNITIWEPGFLRLTIAHLRAGSLPRQAKVQLLLGSDSAIFGLPARISSLEVMLELLDGTGLPWMVGVPWGDVLIDGLAEFAIRRGGHVRVGLEDYRGADQPTNEELVARVVALGRQCGRRPATAGEAASVLWDQSAKVKAHHRLGGRSEA